MSKPSSADGDDGGGGAFLTGAFFERGLRGVELPREGAADPRAGSLPPIAGTRSCMTEEAAPSSSSPAKQLASRRPDRANGAIASLESIGVVPAPPTRYLDDECRPSFEDERAELLGSRAVVRTAASSDEVSSFPAEIPSAEISSAEVS